MSRFPLLQVFLICALGWPTLALAQQAAPTPIGEVLLDVDGDRVPDRIRDTVVVEGVLSADPLVIGPTAALANLQDTTGGIFLFTTDTTLLQPLTAGDSVRVEGHVQQYRGGEQIRMHGYEHLGHTQIPAPQDVLASELQGERFSGRLVRVEGTLRTTTLENGRIAAWLEDRTGRIPVHISGAILADPEFVEQLRRGGSASLVGVASQSTGAEPPIDGYRLIPRGPEDFDLPPVRDYTLLALGAAAALILVLLVWRRATARRAGKLEHLAAELSRSREEIRTREARYRSLVENAMDTVSVVDPEGIVVYQGPSVTRMLGWLPEELEGRSAFEHVHPEDRARVESLFEGLLSEESGYRETELRVQARDESWHHLEVIATNRTHDPAVQGIVCNVRDITHHRALEQRLRQADRLETVGRLAGGIAHDFNNILTAVRGHADMALEEMSENAAGRAEILEIVRNSDRASAVTRHLLAFTRQQVRETRKISASAIIRSMLPTVRRLMGAAIEVSVELREEGDVIEVDPGQIEQVVLNLVLNARDATPDGGRITLRVTEDDITESWASQYPYEVRPGRYVHISVSDTGSGMDESVLSRVFEPFFTTKGPSQGTGLGLATVYGIVKQSGGYIWAESRPGAGTCFDIFFPRVEQDGGEEAASEPELESLAEDSTGSGGTILLVEDEGAVRRLAARVLRKNGYHVLEASRASDALLLLQEHSRIDLLLTDVVMPGMSGLKLAGCVAERRPGLPVLLMSGYTAGEVVEGPVESRPPLLEKPFTPQQLVHRVRECIQRHGSAISGRS